MDLNVRAIKMRLIPHEEINLVDRVRKDFNEKELNDLKKSIHQKGLLHAPVLSNDLRLLSGERRLRCMVALHEEGNDFSYDGEKVPLGSIPYTFVQDLSPADFIEAELEENILRSELSWQETTSARVRIHELRKSQNPEQTQADTAEEIAVIKGTTKKVEQQKLARAIILERHKDNILVRHATNESQAYRAVLDSGNRAFKAQLKAIQGYKSPHTVILGDARDELPKLPDRHFDAIIWDPPYGIDADKMGKGTTHNYQDDAEYARALCEFVITEGFRLCKPQAIMFMFCDPDHFVYLKEYAQRQAWTVWRTPLIWYKGDDGGGNAPWGRYGWKRSYEVIMCLTKGGQELRNSGGSDVITFKRVARSARLHAAEKPIELLDFLVSLAVLPHGTLLDPCAGSGSIISAATRHKVSVTAIELDPAYHAAALERANAGDEGEDDVGELEGAGVDDPDEQPGRRSIADLLAAPSSAPDHGENDE